MTDEKTNDDLRAGLIHQAIPDMEGTEPRPNEVYCRCGHLRDDHGSRYEQGPKGEKRYVQKCEHCPCEVFTEKGGALDRVWQAHASALVAEKLATAIHAALACGDSTPVGKIRPALADAVNAYHRGQ